MTPTIPPVADDEAMRKQFVGWIADRFQQRHTPPLPREEAVQMAADTLEAFEEMEAPFRHPDYTWDVDGARDIADEEIAAGWEFEG